MSDLNKFEQEQTLKVKIAQAQVLREKAEKELQVRMRLAKLAAKGAETVEDTQLVQAQLDRLNEKREIHEAIGRLLDMMKEDKADEN